MLWWMVRVETLDIRAVQVWQHGKGTVSIRTARGGPLNVIAVRSSAYACYPSFAEARERLLMLLRERLTKTETRAARLRSTMAEVATLRPVDLIDSL